jgi:hypothetical protein
VPSGVKASANTGPSWPVSRWRWVAVAVSQRRTVASAPAEARAVPSGVKASARHRPVVAGEPVALGGGGGVPEADGWRRRRRRPGRCRPG